MAFRPDSTRLAQAAYQAYQEATDGKTHDGRSMPAWEDLGTPVQNAWKLAAEAVRHQIEIHRD